MTLEMPFFFRLEKCLSGMWYPSKQGNKVVRNKKARYVIISAMMIRVGNKMLLLEVIIMVT